MTGDQRNALRFLAGSNLVSDEESDAIYAALAETSDKQEPKCTQCGLTVNPQCNCVRDRAKREETNGKQEAVALAEWRDRVIDATNQPSRGDIAAALQRIVNDMSALTAAAPLANPSDKGAESNDGSLYEVGLAAVRSILTDPHTEHLAARMCKALVFIDAAIAKEQQG